MNNEAKFVDGLIIKAPRQGAPDFVKGSISIKRQELINWLSQETEDWVNVDIKESKKGKWYGQVNTWKPEGKTQQVVAPKDELPYVDTKTELDTDEIPF